MVSFLPIYEMYKNTYADLFGIFSPENRFRAVRRGILSKKKGKTGVGPRFFAPGRFASKNTRGGNNPVAAANDINKEKE